MSFAETTNTGADPASDPLTFEGFKNTVSGREEESYKFLGSLKRIKRPALPLRTTRTNAPSYLTQVPPPPNNLTLKIQKCCPPAYTSPKTNLPPQFPHKQHNPHLTHPLPLTNPQHSKSSPHNHTITLLPICPTCHQHEIYLL